MHPPIWDFSMTNVKSIDSKGTCATRLALILNPIVSIAQLIVLYAVQEPFRSSVVRLVSLILN
jgi:hypothetical protein